jgi:hypothetical protein
VQRIKFFSLLVTGIFLSFSCYSLQHDTNTTDRSFDVSAEGVWSTKAKFKDNGIKDQKIRFGSSSGKLSLVQPIGEDNAFLLDVGYTNVYLDWKENPSFSEQNHPLMNIMIGGRSTGLEKWVWTGAVITDVHAEKLNFADNARYKGSMLGRYEYSDEVGVYVGLFGSTGLHKKEIFPIFGVDYAPSSAWKIHVIFPMKLSAEYFLTENKQWSLSAEGRSFKTRHRLGRKELLSKGIFEYRSYGGDLALNYTLDMVTAKAFAGMKSGGDLKIMDSQGKNPSHYRYKGSLYFGGNVEFSF